VVLILAGIAALPPALLERPLLATVPRRWALQVAGRWSLQALEPPFALPGYSVQMIWSASIQHSAPHRWLRSQVIAAAAAAAA
jgi:hypothetical protein